jgi:hypothetical protein
MVFRAQVYKLHEAQSWQEKLASQKGRGTLTGIDLKVDHEVGDAGVDHRLRERPGKFDGALRDRIGYDTVHSCCALPAQTKNKGL